MKSHLLVASVFVAAGLVAGGLWSRHQHHVSPTPTATPTATPLSCRSDAWAHVYHPARLKILSPCIQATGVIKLIRKEADGDDHILVDIDDKSLVNQANIEHQMGDLVVEPICLNVVTQGDAMAACAGYSSGIVVPPVGTRVRITGPWVEDTMHFNWREIHPVISMEVLP